MVVWFSQRGGILTVLSTDKDNYTVGEPVRMSLVKVNVSPYPITFTYPTSQRYDFIVSGFAGEVWRWSADRFFIPVVETITLNPGESKSYVATWLQVNQNGQRVPPGFYRVTGLNTATNIYQPGLSVLIAITG